MQPPIAKPIGSSTPSKNNNNTSLTSLTSIQLPVISSQSVISSAPIAFAAIAKHNTCKLKFLFYFLYFFFLYLIFI